MMGVKRMHKQMVGIVLAATLLSGCDAQTMQAFEQWQHETSQGGVVSAPPAFVQEPAKAAEPGGTTMEVVNMNLRSQAHLARLAEMIAGDPPSRVEMNCALSDPFCAQAKQMLEQRGVVVTMSHDADVTLIYHRVVVPAGL